MLVRDVLTSPVVSVQPTTDVLSARPTTDVRVQGEETR